VSRLVPGFPRLIAGVLATLVLALLALGGGGAAEAQQPAATPPIVAERLEAQAFALERQLLCPQCTNKRLDVCEIAICQDMKSVIRSQLAAGATGDEILLYFSNRYGPRVLAQLPREGFNLWLWGWVGGSVATVAALGAWVLISQRRTADATAAPPTSDDDRWLDEQLAHPDA
jgi:cytochrome c-type biogenesis protein CcmH/NrfF